MRVAGGRGGEGVVRNELQFLKGRKIHSIKKYNAEAYFEFRFKQV